MIRRLGVSRSSPGMIGVCFWLDAASPTRPAIALRRTLNSTDRFSAFWRSPWLSEPCSRHLPHWQMFRLQADDPCGWLMNTQNVDQSAPETNTRRKCRLKCRKQSLARASLLPRYEVRLYLAASVELSLLRDDDSLPRMRPECLILTSSSIWRTFSADEQTCIGWF